MSKTNYITLFLCASVLVIKIFSTFVTNFDFFGDEAQYWLWSKVFDFGYYSKPPMLPWVIGVFCKIFGDSFFAIKMIPIFTYCISSYIIYLISLKLDKNFNLAVTTSLAFFLMPAVLFSSFFVSTDVLLVFFWALSLLQLLNIKENPNRLNFILLGIFVGLAFLTKYAAIYFFLCFVLLFFEKDMRSIFLRHRASVGLFFVIFFIIIAPNILWNLKNNWVTFDHTASNAALDRASVNFYGGLQFFVSQIIMIGPVIFVFFIFKYFKSLTFDFNTKFLLTFSIPIFLIVLLEGVLVRSNANWAAVSLISFLILFVRYVYSHNKTAVNINNYLNFCLGCVLFFFIASNSSLKPFKRITGITDFVNYLEGQNLNDIGNIVISDRMLFSNISYILRNKKIIIYTSYKPNKHYAHHFQITSPLPKGFNKDFMFLGDLNEINYLDTDYVVKHIKNKIVEFKNEPIRIYEIKF